MRPPDDEQHLIKTILGGDVEAFGLLVERYEKPLYNAAYRITGNRDDAMEATQTAFLKVYDRLRSYDPRHRFFSWIFRIVVNESLDIAHQRRRYVADGDGSVGDVPAQGTPESEYSSAQASALVHRALRSLSPEHRAVLVLRHFHEMSYAEMGAALGIPEKTVKSRLFSARRELRLALEGAASAQRA